MEKVVIEYNKKQKAEIGNNEIKKDTLTGYIYIIKSKKTEDVYIGSTIHPILKRFKQHIYNFGSGKCSSEQIIKYGDSFCELLETYNYNNVIELRNREKELIKNKRYKCTNIIWNTVEDDDIINDDSSANTNNNLLNYAIKEFPNAKNFEDCFDKDKITDEMKQKCLNKYYTDGAVYLLSELCDIGRSKRPIHCTDVNRLNFIIKRKGKWSKDISGKKIKKLIMPIIDIVYHGIYTKMVEKTGDIAEYMECIESLSPKRQKNDLKKLWIHVVCYFIINIRNLL